MTITLTLAHVDVTDLARSERWYQQVFACPPHTRPMGGLVEWRFGPNHGVQLFEEAERAGSSTVVMAPTDFDGIVRRLSDLGIDHDGVQPGGGGRLLSVSDPDGNRVVLLDDQAAVVDRQTDSEVRFATLRFERRLAAPIDRVWTAHADVEERKVWSVPEGDDLIYDTSDFSVGGCDQYRCGPRGDLVSHVTTRYLEIDAPRSFVAANVIRRSDAVIATDTTRFALDSAGSSTVLTLTVQVTSLRGVALLDGYTRGHERVSDQLQQYVEASRMTRGREE